MSRGQEKTPSRRSRVAWIIRFVIVAIAGMLGTFVILDNTLVEKSIVDPYCEIVAASCRIALGVLGITAWGAANQVQSSKFSIEIISACTGLDVAGILCAAIVAFPATRKNKLIGMIGGFVAVYFMNLVRVLALFLLGSERGDIFRSAHLVYAQGYMIVLAAGIWFLWAVVCSRYGVKRRPTIFR
jgi:exosortase/archaeosortase family protein